MRPRAGVLKKRNHISEHKPAGPRVCPPWDAKGLPPSFRDGCWVHVGLALSTEALPPSSLRFHPNSGKSGAPRPHGHGFSVLGQVSIKTGEARSRKSHLVFFLSF